MAAKQPKPPKQRRRTASDDKRKAQASLAVQRRAKSTNGRNVRARLEQLTAELDARTAEVQTAYAMTAPPREIAGSADTLQPPVTDLAEALRGL